MLGIDELLYLLYVYKTKKLIKTYNEPPYDEKTKMSGKIDEGKEFYLIGEADSVDCAYVLLKDTNVGTWIVFEADKLVKGEKVDLSNIINKPEEPTTEPTTTQAVQEEDNKGNFLSKFSNTELIIIAASVGVILSLTAIVCVVLVNKKKKVKPLETVETLEPVSGEQPPYVSIENDEKKEE